MAESDNFNQLEDDFQLVNIDENNEDENQNIIDISAKPETELIIPEENELIEIDDQVDQVKDKKEIEAISAAPQFLQF